ncbi:putative antitoxin HigA2 [Streptomyces sp. RB5]|uniref:Putative antitoxin HigA2 n=1 Tax=Streptomyces smaragdinus TaxID=2585196 RepID=A0A7K0CNH4_9ACTN|nr:helix-turn-helix transcriptional regulator [Streptomyces smaragdinus]MQY15047.1 putative antitoxin HigA2 [Streptomyces smaragdinus]
MSPARRWQDVKAEAHRRHPELHDPRLRERADAELDAQIAGFHLRELRRLVGKTQADVAAAIEVSQSRISQIENGDLDSMELETLRAYAAALGGHVDVTVGIGPHAVKVA